MRRRPAVWLLSLVLTAAALAGCGATDKSNPVGQGVGKAKECANLLGELTSLDFDPKAGAAKLDQTARQLDRALREVDSTDVRKAGNELLLRVRRLRDAVRTADPAQERRALQAVTQAAERLARTCNVPVDQVTG